MLLRPKRLHTQSRLQIRPCQLVGPAVVGPNPPSWLLRAAVASHPPSWLLRAVVASHPLKWLLQAVAGSHPPRWLQGAAAPWMASPRLSRRGQRAPAQIHPALALFRTMRVRPVPANMHKPLGFRVCARLLVRLNAVLLSHRFLILKGSELFELLGFLRLCMAKTAVGTEGMLC